MNYVSYNAKRTSIRLTGAVYTPSEVAAALISVVMPCLPKRHLRVLEPSAGDGAFLEQLDALLPDNDCVAVDIDEEVVKQLRQSALFSTKSTTLHTRDFVQFACEALETRSPSYDFIIGNPPFIRKHNFIGSFKESLQRLSTYTGYPLSELKNSWAAFLLASAELVSNDGVVAFILPYELITVVYGQAVLSRMLDVFPRVDLFVSDEKAFPEIEQDAVIFVGQRAPSGPHGLFVQRVASMSHLSDPIEHPLILAKGRPLALDLNAFLISRDVMPTLRRLQANLAKFSDLATTEAGIVTAANEFFILRDADVRRLNLSTHVLPIVKKQSSSDRSLIFSNKSFEKIAKHDPCRLLYIKGDFNDLDEDVRAYIAAGSQSDIPERYKCRNRKNWYEVPLVRSAPGFFFKRSYAYPRLCVNEAGVHVTDTAYGIRPKDGHSIRGICFSFYNSITMLFAETNGRFYGGGVLELSPNELRGLPIIYHEPTDHEFDAFASVYEKAGGDPEPILEFGDRWASQYLIGEKVDLKSVRRAWAAVRSHRLRHSQRSSV